MSQEIINRTNNIAAPGRSTNRLRTLLSPGYFWLTLGVLAVALQTWVYTRWAMDGRWRPSFSRPPSLPNINAFALRLLEAFTIASTIVCIIFVIHEWRRQGRPDFDAAALIGYTSTMWLDVLCGGPVQWNSYSIHVATWFNYMPGLTDITAPDPFTPVFSPNGLGYPAMMIPVLIGYMLTKLVLRKREHWGRTRRFAVALVFGIFLQFLVEITFIQAGTYSMNNYSTLAQSLSLWGGHWYQIAAPDTIVLGGLATAPLIHMRMTWRSGGTPFISRGLPDTRTRLGGFLQILCAIGWCNLTIAVWMGVAHLMSINGVPVSDLPEYFRN
ncbi:spirocyclase AveC family protein [Nocardia sp. NBC_00565]|uniref:spirocyclase AveC family protein n=1 Tax=Nocardia sp. NBC_00565 TaxID=2975993 RepID=UPI002E8144B8|nr:spirocyclase AveC family protein [Nocardia sp. NBC_00565]WUC06147.1 spirocyclase AveC family protein [Nocardia sp. NBC_00565]